MSFLIQVNIITISDHVSLAVHLVLQNIHKISLLLILSLGVVVGIESCNVESPPLRDPTLWTFTTGWFVNNRSCNLDNSYY